MNKFIGSISKIIYQSDSSYMVILFKVLKNDLDDSYNNHSIKITGHFFDIMEGLIIEVTGMMQKHVKYGESFAVSSYQEVIPDEKNSIVKFLASDYFKGIGEAKALKLYETFGDKVISLIKEDPHLLDKVDFLTNKNKLVIVTKLNELNNSSEILLKLTDLGFSIKDSTLIYKYYKEDTLKVLENNLYTFFYDLDKISFGKVDLIARNNKILKDDKRRVKAGIIESLRTLAFERGDTYSDLLELRQILKIVINYEISDDLFFECLGELEKDLYIFKEDDTYQLKEYFEADHNILKRLTYLNNKEVVNYKPNTLEKYILEFEKEYKIEYDLKQQEAIKNAFLKNILIITGGPGTGKTTIIKTIVSLYKKIYKKDDDIALLAPTGRASKRIMETTGYKASTIHRFLKWNKDTNKFQINEYNKSDVKLVIVDEVSMLDTILFSSLLNGLKYDIKLILVGDSNQLPSVSPGNVLKDLIQSDVFKVIELERLYRQSKGSNIINLAYNINAKKLNYAIFNKDDDLFFYQASSLNLKDNLITIINKYEKIDYHDFQIMAPMYKTLNGINNLNKIVQELLNPKKNNKNEIIIGDFLYREGDKVLQLVNMPDDNVYNGDIGIILEINNVLKEITIDFDGNIVTYNSTNFLNFTLGYVISIHKSQGSEFKIVVIPILNEYRRMLYKKLIYTGVTRAKEKLLLLGEVDAFEKSVFNDLEDNRKTNLAKKIKKRYQK